MFVQKMKSDTASGSLYCSRCGKTLTKATQSKSIHCSGCSRWYHKKCFMTDTGAEAVKCVTTSKSCVCCLSIPTAEAKLKCSRGTKKYVSEFLTNGFCVIPLGNNTEDQCKINATLASWSVELVEYYHALLKTYECQSEFGKAVPTLESGYANFRQRCPGRFEIIAEFISDQVVPLVEESKSVQETLTSLLCSTKARGDKKLMSSGCFLSLAGSETQNYHTDGPALSTVVNLFPYAINVFVPLVPVDNRNGTEFIPGSQIVGEHDDVKSVRPSVAVGSALLFDYRVVHRGLKNAKLDPRPCYYATYSQSWYKDTYNFSKSRYKRDLQVNPDFLESRSVRMAKRFKGEYL